MERKRFWAAGESLLRVGVAILLLASAATAGERNTVYQFKGGTDGSMPQEGLIIDSAGNLYGTTLYGGGGGCGGKGCGTVFKLSPNSDGSWTESLLHIFVSDPDSGPGAGLIFDHAGNLYGTTIGAQWGWGSVFKLGPNPDGSWTESMLWTPKVHEDGYEPHASLTMDAAGNLYGTTQWGGGGPPYSGGVVFRLTPNQDGSWTYSKLYAFQGNPDGRLPIHNPVVFDNAGNLYGQTTYGGDTYPVDGGTVYKLAPSPDGTWAETVLYCFEEGDDGDNPTSNLVFGPDGSLYGSTYRGGGSGCNEPGYYDGMGCGTIFRMTPQPDGNWKLKIIYRFSGPDGGNPSGPLTFDTRGNLYGTTFHGGDMACGTEAPPLGCGTVFRLSRRPDGSLQMRVLAFHNHPNSHGVGGLVLDEGGNIYGISGGDGKTTFGSVFKIAR